MCTMINLLRFDDAYNYLLLKLGHCMMLDNQSLYVYV